MKFSEKPIYVIIGAIVVCSALVGGLAGYFTAQALVSGKPFLNNVNNLISDQKVMNQNASDGIVKVVEQSSPAVVSIIVSKDLPKVIQSPNDLFRQFFGGTLTPSTNGETEKQTIGGGSVHCSQAEVHIRLDSPVSSAN
jgi:S1-C subfamily serine protease